MTTPHNYPCPNHDRLGANSLTRVSPTPPQGGSDTRGLHKALPDMMMFPVFCVDEGFLGARASRPHNPRHSPAHLRHLDRPATAPGDLYTSMRMPGLCTRTDPVNCSGLQASRFLKKSCALMLIIPVNHEARGQPTPPPLASQIFPTPRSDSIFYRGPGFALNWALAPSCRPAWPLGHNCRLQNRGWGSLNWIRFNSK